MADKVSAVFEIAKFLSDHLVAIMKDQIDAADETRAGVVRAGPLQDSPLRGGGINVLIQYNDLDDPKTWMHTVATRQHQEDAGMGFPVREIGGLAFWFRRYVVELTTFLRPNTQRERAEELAHIILSRAEQALEQAPLPDTDSFGETPLQASVIKSSNVEGGGGGQLIFYGKIYIQVLTEKT